MKKTFFNTFLFSVFLPSLAYAQTQVGDLIDSATSVFATFIPILLGLAVLVFFWGLVKFIAHAEDEKTHEEGKQLMVWGMVAIFVMIALWGIVGWLQTELGLDTLISPGTLPAQPNSIPSPVHV